jgi:hypothetical protein
LIAAPLLTCTFEVPFIENTPREVIHTAIDTAARAIESSRLWVQQPSLFSGIEQLNWQDVVHMAVHVVSKRRLHSAEQRMQLPFLAECSLNQTSYLAGLRTVVRDGLAVVAQELKTGVSLANVVNEGYLREWRELDEWGPKQRWLGQQRPPNGFWWLKQPDRKFWNALKNSHDALKSAKIRAEFDKVVVHELLPAVEAQLTIEHLRTHVKKQQDQLGSVDIQTMDAVGMVNGTPLVPLTGHSDWAAHHTEL